MGERGITLSSRQRQRIGIARGGIRNAPILILDEPSAALDAESEKPVMEGLDRLMKGRTVITLALDGICADLYWTRIAPAGSLLPHQTQPAREAVCPAG